MFRGACAASRCMAPWCSGQTCHPVTVEIVGSNPIGVVFDITPTPLLDGNGEDNLGSPSPRVWDSLRILTREFPYVASLACWPGEPSLSPAGSRVVGPAMNGLAQADTHFDPYAGPHPGLHQYSLE